MIRNKRSREFKPAPSTQVKNSPSQILGYMPKRKGFEFCCNNDAEQFIAQMEFLDDDSLEDI